MPPSPRDPMLKKKRMDFVSQLDKSAFALIVYSYFLNPSMFILISRGITQTQISRPHESHPTSTLRTMTTLLLSNLFITTLYNIMFGPTGSETEVKGIFLDFVGQATPSTPLHLHTLSFLLFVLQYLCLLSLNSANDLPSNLKSHPRTNPRTFNSSFNTSQPSSSSSSTDSSNTRA
ncbi:hypothetical protein BDY24DRAFT_416797 [Mrakia frigida]|uniref:uncharacterized protein n=1 Tax=Mrakia frigida TaxID=29902 RepID=UPI003FCC1853